MDCWSVPKHFRPFNLRTAAVRRLATHLPFLAATPPTELPGKERDIGAGSGRRDRGSSASVLTKSITLKLKVQAHYAIGIVATVETLRQIVEYRVL